MYSVPCEVNKPWHFNCETNILTPSLSIFLPFHRRLFFSPTFVFSPLTHARTLPHTRDWDGYDDKSCALEEGHGGLELLDYDGTV
jgi:hypothetical protein